MPYRRVLGTILVAVLAIAFANCGNHKLVSIGVTPNSATSDIGQSVQFHAVGSYVLQSSRQRPPSTQDITDQVSWSSGNPAVATINSSGLAQVVGLGSTTIVASENGLSGNALLFACGPLSAGKLGLLTAINIIPSSQTTTVVGENAQYVAIGTVACGDSTTTQDITTFVKWVSSDQSVATVNDAGLATSVGAGSNTATITAMGTASNGSVITGTATFSGCASGCGPVTLPTLSVYEVGLGSGSVTGVDSANPNVTVINCDPSSGNTAGCTASVPVGATVVLTATPGTNSTFGGWSANCTPIRNNTCSVTIPLNQPSVPVGAIFN